MSKTYQYLIVIEKTNTGFSAYCPDVPGCVATGEDKQIVEKNMQEALSFHFEGMKDLGKTFHPPKGQSYSRYMELAI